VALGGLPKHRHSTPGGTMFAAMGAQGKDDTVQIAKTAHAAGSLAFGGKFLFCGWRQDIVSVRDSLMLTDGVNVQCLPVCV